MKKAFHIANALRMTAFLTRVIMLPLLLCLSADAQQLELSSGSASTVATGPTPTSALANTGNQTATFLHNIGTSATFTAFANPTTTYSVSLSNQQYTSATYPGITFGSNNVANNTTTLGPLAIYAPLNTIGSPLANMFTSSPDIATSGTNMDIANNYAFYMRTDAFYQLGNPLTARNYYGDITVTFSRAVVNPVIHVSGMGGNYYNSVSGGQGFYTELEMSTPGLTLTRLSGSSTMALDATNTKILNTNVLTDNTAAGGTNYTSSQVWAGAGSLRINTSTAGITSITFKVYLKGQPANAATNVWGVTGSSVGRSGDGWMLGASLGLTTISGTVFGDGNGLTDGIVNGTGTNGGGALFANLLDASNNIIGSSAVAANGTYSFVTADYINGNYKIVLTTSAVSNTAALPTGYQNMGENLGAGSGSDGLSNGILSISVTNLVNVSNANFGINKPPTANNVSGGSQSNPGGTTQVTAPTLTGSDPEDGTYTGLSNTNDIIIQSLPSNGILYYNGVAVTAGQTITNYNPTLLKVDPNDNITSLTFTYSEIDAAGFISLAAMVTMFVQTNCATIQLGTTNIGGIVSSYFLPSNATVAVGSTSLNIAAGTVYGASGSIAAGDLLLIIQMQDGANTDVTNTATYGTVSSTRAGQYEYVVASNAITQTVGGALNFESINGGGLTNQYIQNTVNGTARQTFQVVKVPNYENVILTSTITGTNWDGLRGGIAAIKVLGNTNFSNSYGINVSSLGFRGAAGTVVSGISTGSLYRNVSNNHGALKGEGIAGTPSFINPVPGGPSFLPQATSTDYVNGSFMIGAPGNAGGGGKDAGPAANCYDNGNASNFNTGGGGGSNAGTGGHGGFGWCTAGTQYGLGARSLSTFTNRMFMGGGGGAGEAQNNSRSYGGYGGGLVFFYTGSVSNTGATTSITANGENPNKFTFHGQPSNCLNDGAGGGGAGGSIYAFSTSGLGALNLSANGSVGGNPWREYNAAPTQTPTQSPFDDHGPGGGGGGGKITASTTTGTVSVAGGAEGHFWYLLYSNGVNIDRGAFGATAGTTGITAAADAPLLITSCLDFGDAPVSYSTLLANAGAKHALTSPTSGATLYLGASRADQEDNGQPNITATGDGSDEDGIATVANYSGTGTYTATITANNGTGSVANLYAWFDANSNGAFEASEIFTTTIATGASSTVATWTGLPTTGLPAYTYVRVRLTSDALADNSGTAAIDERSTGNANNGEVEDYQVLMNPVTISGVVYNDVDGLSNLIVDGVGTNASASLYAVLYNNTTNQVAGVMAVPSNGVYSFTNAAGDNYTVYLTTNIPVVGQTAVPPVTLPASWVNTGENIGAGAGNDGTVNGVLLIGVANANVTNANFGIEQQPTAGAGANTTANTGVGTQITVPANTFTNTTASSDPSPGAVSSIKITAFPTGAASIVINGTSYNSGNFPAGGVTVPTDVSGNPTQTITVSPAVNGATSVSIPFVAVDAAGVVSSNTGTAVLNLTTVSISGIVFNDVNGLADGTVNGSVTNAGGLNAVLVNAVTGNVVASTAVGAGGTYTFAGQNGGNYNVLITTSTATVGSAAPAVVLPGVYVNTGENIGTAAGNDGTPNGILPLGNVTANITNANFGIDRIPTANAVTGTTQQNPGGNAKVVVPTLNGTDPEQGTFNGTGLLDSVIINTLPVNGTLYYNGVAVLAGDTIKNYNPALLMVDPNDGITSLTFTYSEIDAALKSSSPATVTMPFTTPVPFACNGLAYQVTGTPTSTLNSYNINTGVRTALFSLGFSANNIGYSPVDNFLWGWDITNSKVFRVGSDGLIAEFTIPNLPTGFGTGDVLPGGYLVLLNGAAGSTYYVVDINPTHANYLQLVDPTASYIVDVAPYGTAFSPASTIFTNDFSYNPTTGLLSGIVSPGQTNAFKIVSVNPITRAVTYSAAAVTGSTFQTETSTFGATLIDANSNVLYAFANTVGAFYRVNLATNTATLLSTPGAATNNDGASCPIATLSYSISGNIYNDVNGLSDALVNGTGTNAGGINAILYDVTTGAVAAVAAVATDGTYSFGATPGNNFNIYLTTATATVGSATIPTITLPTGYASTGENIGTAAGNDGTVNSILPIGVVSAAVANANFGIEQRPTAGAGTQTVDNPGGTNNLTVNATAFTSTTASSDVSPGAVTAILITAIPTGATTITINGTTYGPGFTAFPSAGVTVPANASGQPTQTIAVDPTANGATSVTIPFKAVDAAGITSTNIGNAVVTISDLVLSGSVFNDPNGVTNSLIDGTLITIAGTQLYVNLVNPTSGLVVGTSTVAAGLYSFGNATGLQANTNFNVVVSTVLGVVGTTTGASSTLPAPWVNTAEGSGVGDGNVNGILVVSMGTADITTNSNFGIESRPTAGSGSGSAVNPGNTTQVTVPVTAFTSTTASTDPTVSPNGVTSIRITAFPTGATTIVINGTSYTSATFPAAGVVVPASSTGQPSQTITVDPTAAGATSVTIPFVAIDIAGKESANTGNAVINFTAVTISGNVYNDVNGLSGTPTNTVGGTLVNGTDIDAGTAGNQALYASLVSGSTILATVPVNASGAYSFPDVASGSYNVVLTTNATGSTTALPTDGQGWRNVGENIGTAAGNDGTINGILPVTMAGVSIANANFGIEQPPTAGGGSQTVALTPAGTTQTTVSNTTFTNTASSTDPSPGAVTSIRITAFPSGATTIVINSISYTSATFPVAGVVVPASAAGAPSQTITVDPAALVAIPTTVTIPFRAIDAAGVESANIGNAIINYGGALTISGSVYNDVNGLNGTPANVVNGTLVNGTDLDASAAGTQTLYATLVSVGLPVATVPVSSTGTYIFGAVTSGLSYSVVLHTTSGGSTTASLPTAGSGWVNTGENIGLAAGSDATPDGVLSLGIIIANVTNANFGIEQPPAAGSGSNTAVNPGGNTQVTVPANTFTNTALSSDPTPGSISGIKITAFPTGASSVVVNGTTYNSGVPAEVAALLALTIPADASGNPTQTITVDPTAAAGVTSVVINFKAIDAAGVLSANTGTATLNLTGMSVSGTVFNDVDGLVNSIVDGTAIDGTDIDAVTAGSQTIYASLVQGGSVIATVPVTNTGTYTFSNVSSGSFTVVLNTSVGGSTTAALPSAGNGWVNTGENIGTGIGNDGTINGILAVTVTAGVNVTNANMGIQQPPFAGNGTQSSANPGSTNPVVVNASTFTNGLTTTDVAPGTITGIRITAIPTGATSITIDGTTYGPGFTTFPAAGVDVPTDATGNPTQTISVDPTAAGATTVTIVFKAIDNAGTVSNNTGNAVINLTSVGISGTVFDDANALTDLPAGIVNGTAINGLDIDPITLGNQALFASLIQGGSIIATVPVTNVGTYTFADVPTGTYTVVLHSNASGSLVSTLPTAGNGWLNTGENIGTSPGNDGAANGELSVAITGLSVTDANFGIQQPPTAGSGSNGTANPGGTISVTVPTSTFTNSSISADPDGTVTSVKITSFPADANSLSIGTVTYYLNAGAIPGVCPTASCLAFPGAGIILATDNAGNPSAAIMADPSSLGVTTIDIPFVSIDNGGMESANTGHAIMNFTDLLISGNVYHDADGGTISGTPINVIGTNTLYMNLVDGSNHVVASVPVNGDGTYSFGTQNGITASTSYLLILSATQGTQGNTPPSNSLVNAANTAEGAVAAGDGTPNGFVGVSLGTTSISSVNFAVEELPTAGSGSNTVVNPGGTTQVSVPLSTFINISATTDPDGTVPNIRITSFPTNATSVVINGTTYTVAGGNGTTIWPGAGVITPVTSLGSVDPNFNGAGQVVFSFKAIDNAGKESSNIGTATLNFLEPTVTVSGTVWDDASANAVEDGGEVAILNGSVWVNLVDPSTNDVVQSVQVDGSGNYTFTGVAQSTNYSIILSAADQTGNTNLSVATIPTGFINTGVNLNGSANTANTSGIINLNTGTSNTIAQNFGIQQIPIVGGGSNSAVNPGGLITVNVPASTFTNTTASDDIDGTVTSIKINGFPTGATSLTIGTATYYPTAGAIPGVCPTAICLAFPAAGVIVPTDGDGNPATSIFADPLATGSTTVTIPFVAIDNAGSESAIGFGTMNFAAPGTIIISGNVWDDGDGNAINDNGENTITDGSVWVNLVNPATDDVIQSVQVDGSGNYSFTGVTPNANYTIILSNSNEAGNINLTSASLPVGLVSTGVNLDATANTSNKTAIISISAGIVSISNQDFGVGQLPIAITYLANSQVNPGGSTSVNVISTNFSGTDADGIISNIKITGFPTNATSISVGTVTYYPTAGDIPSVCPTTSCLVFPAEGVTTTTNASGNPIAAINIDPLDGTVTVVIPYKTIDNAGQESTLEADVILPFTTPVSLPPVAQNINNPAINNSAAQSHIGGLVASDPQGDPINSFSVLTIPSATEGVLYTCSNNTVPCTGSFAAIIANQVLTPAQAAALYFDPANTFTGMSIFTYNASSINGSSNTATVNIPVVNNPPTANSFTTAPVAQNSSNNLLPALTGADGDGTVVSYTVAPPNAAEGSITYCTNPPGSGCGTAVAAQTVLTPAQISSISFTPASGFLGNATFTYIVTDNNGNTSTQATVTVPVTPTGGVPINLPPVTQNVTIEPLNSNAAATPISALVGSDPDGTIANYTIMTIPSASVGVLYYCTTGNYPCTGTLTAVTNGTTLTSAQASTLQFDPAADNNNSATFTYTAIDNLGLVSNTSNYVIPIENQPPTAIAIHAAVPYNSTNSAVPALQGNDVDGTISSYTVTSVPNTATEGTLFFCASGTQPACTPVAVSNGTILTSAQAATVTFTPVTSFTGTAVGAYTATDNNGKTSQAASIVIDVENYSYAGQPPVANGSSFNIGGNAGNTALPVTFITGVDPDGTVASYAVTSLPPVSHGVFTYCTAPPTINCGTLLNLGDVLTPAQAATISFTPTATYAGPAYLGFTVTDNSGNLSNIANSVVNIENEPPIATGYTTATVKNGGSVINTPLQATDLMDGGSITSFSITSVPTTNNGTLTYCAGGVPGCASPTTIIVGTTLTPAEAATVRYTPGILMAVSEVPFTFTATDNSGNLSNVATIVIPVTIIPDLTPIIRLPNNSFTSTGTGAELLMVGELVSLINISTTTGSTKFSITAPVGYTISFDPAMTSIDVSGGTGTTLVQNPSWTLLSTQLGGRRLNFQAKEGIFIGGLLKAELGFKIKRTTSFQGSQPVVTINIADDSTIQYDSVTPNNIFTRILNSL